MNFFYRFREKLARFMEGRYGTDSLNRSLTILWLIIAIVGLFLRTLALHVIQWIFAVVVFYRMLSKNYVKRERENAAWLRMSSGLRAAFRRLIIRFRDRKTTRFFKCPHCKAPIRMPKKSGRFNIRCRKCGNTFTKEFR